MLDLGIPLSAKIKQEGDVFYVDDNYLIACFNKVDINLITEIAKKIAIREGVKKTFEITQDHFMENYGLKARFFVYNSSNLHQLDEFAQNSGINVMNHKYAGVQYNAQRR